MMKQAIFMPILLASLVGWASSASAEMYKWTDSSGKTHYSATPPPADVKAKILKLRLTYPAVNPRFLMHLRLMQPHRKPKPKHQQTKL